MERINGNNTVDIGGGKRGFRSQNAAAGVAGTEVTDKFLNDIQEEISAVIENSGFELDPDNQQQLWDALQNIAAPGFANRTPWLPVLSITTIAPPNDAATGDAYIIPSGATGAWAGHTQKLAEWSGVKWRIIPTKDGHGVSLPDGRIFERVSGVYIEKLALDVQSGRWNYAEASGSANALNVSLNPTPAAYYNGMLLAVLVDSKNTGPVSLKINSLSTVPVRTPSGAPLIEGDLAPGVAFMIFSEGSFLLISKTSNVVAGSQVFNTPGTTNWTVPDGVTKVFAKVWGAGGGGGGSSANGWAGSGGGGGGYTEGAVSVTPGQNIPIIVGAGGTAGTTETTAPDDGGSGGTSSFGPLISASGGTGGWRATSGPQTSGAGQGGKGVGGSLPTDGQWGGYAIPLDSTRIMGGFGGASPFSFGNAGPNVNTTGMRGLAPGGGGNGGVGVKAGGNGGNGMIILQW